MGTPAPRRARGTEPRSASDRKGDRHESMLTPLASTATWSTVVRARPLSGRPSSSASRLRGTVRSSDADVVSSGGWGRGMGEVVPSCCRSCTVQSRTRRVVGLSARRRTRTCDGKPERRPRGLAVVPTALPDGAGGGPVEEGGMRSGTQKASRRKTTKSTGEMLSDLWGELKKSTTPLREDNTPEAIALLATLDAAKSRPAAGEQWTDAQWRVQEEAASGVGEAVATYWGAKWDALVNSDAVKDAAPLVTSAVNVAIAGVLLRLALPRIAALQAVGGFDELADFFGLPPRAELSGYLDQLQGFPTLAVFGVYVALFAAEKLTMTDEFLPIGFILPVVSPAVFGGVLGGTVLTSLASTMAASLNFFLGRTVLRERAMALKWGDSPTVGESKWFQALCRRFDSSQFPESEFPLTEGFKSALLLRLCPILPIPLSGNWYVCGMTPLKFPEFFAAHFIGSSKTAFVDAYLGSLLLQAAFESETMKEQAQTVLVFETVALVVISIGVTTYATDLFTQILEEEGIDASNMLGSDDNQDGEGGLSGGEGRRGDLGFDVTAGDEGTQMAVASVDDKVYDDIYADVAEVGTGSARNEQSLSDAMEAAAAKALAASKSRRENSGDESLAK